jgi:hypothetical protein
MFGGRRACGKVMASSSLAAAGMVNGFLIMVFTFIEPD